MSAACRLAVAATAVVVVGGCRSKPGPRVSLRYHPPTGATFHYTLEQQNSVKMEGGPMAQLPGQEITLHIYYSQAVTGTTTVPAGMAPALDRMRGLTSKVVYDDRMHVVSASFSGIEGQQSPVVEQMGNSVRGMTVPLPEGPVGVGDSWSSETELPIAARLGASAPLKARTKHTLKAIQVAGADTSILLTVETSFPGEPFTITQLGRTATVKLTGVITGEQVFSLAKSVPVRYSMGGTMRIAVHDPQSGAAGMTIAMEQQTSLQLTGTN